MNRRALYGTAAVGALAMLYGVLFGPWWLTFAGAVVIGAVMTRARMAILAAALVALVGWSIPLATIQLHYGLGPAAGALAAIMGFKGEAAIPVVLTMLVGVLLGVSGAWFGSSARTVVLSRPSSRPTEKLGDQRLEVKDSVLTKR